MNNIAFKKRLVTAGKPIVVDFWAPWCAPCRMTKPVLEKLAAEYEDKIAFLPINADESRDLLEEYHISGIPTVIAFRDGKVAGRIVGARDEAGFKTMFEALASGSEIKVPMRQFDRILRLVAGTITAIIGIVTGYWEVAGIGGVIAFLGIYDRCPIWAAITRIFHRKKNDLA